MKNLTFEFTSYEYAPSQNRVFFHYAVRGAVNAEYTETLILPEGARTVPEMLLNEILLGVHMMLGISYWKSYCPREIAVLSGTLSKDQAGYWNTVYTKGLGEFFYKNSIDFHGLVKFPFHDTSKNPQSLPLQKRSLVGIGGGKDSLVSVELLKENHTEITGMIIETQKEYALLEEVLPLTGINTLKVQRMIDQQLMDSSQKEYDGHIPISGVYAWIGMLIAALYDYQNVIVSNERSANYGNVEYLGEMINHQWSKSEEFEKMTQQYVGSSITSDLHYFSLLRPYSEMKIVELFTRYPQYFSHFSSCNRNFSITKKNTSKWCGECPKCAFVFVLLAAYLPKDQVVSLFGKNMLADESIMYLYKELLGIAGIKPFECVGTPEETRYAFSLIQKKGEYDGDVILQMFDRELASEISPDELKKHVMEHQDSPGIPEEFQSIIQS